MRESNGDHKFLHGCPPDLKGQSDNLHLKARAVSVVLIEGTGVAGSVGGGRGNAADIASSASRTEQGLHIKYTNSVVMSWSACKRPRIAAIDHC